MIGSDEQRVGARVVAEALRAVGRERRPVFGSAAVACAVALVVGGGIVAVGFAVSWGLFLAARRDAEFSIENEDSYAAYADQYRYLLKVAYGVYPLLLVVAVVLVAWLFTAQAVTAANAREPGALTLRALWCRSRPHLGAAVRVQLLTLLGVLVPGLAGLLVLVVIQLKMVPGVVWPTYHEPATVQFILVGRILPVVIWALGFVLLARLSLATAVRVADNSSATAAMRRSWTLTRTARLRTIGIFLLGAVAVVVAFTVLKWLGTYVAHWAGLLMLATTTTTCGSPASSSSSPRSRWRSYSSPWRWRRRASCSPACANGSPAVARKRPGCRARLPHRWARGSGLDEGQDVGVEDVRVGGEHSVG